LREVADPRAAHTEAEQDEWQNTAARSGQRSEEAARHRQPLLVPRIHNSIFLID